MRSKPGCEARQYSDSMQCSRCGITWDVNDPEPPDCTKINIGVTALTSIKSALHDHASTCGLLNLPERPLHWLPAFGMRRNLVKINWPTYPEAAFAAIRHLEVSDEKGHASRAYIFYDNAGDELFEVQVREQPSGRQVTMRQGGLWLSI